jgi:hypothetical protein
MFVMIVTGFVLIDLYMKNFDLSFENVPVKSLPSNSDICTFVDSFVGFNDEFRSIKLSDPSDQPPESAIFTIWCLTHHNILTNQRAGFHRMILRQLTPGVCK